jgi:hypothetical protein
MFLSTSPPLRPSSLSFSISLCNALQFLPGRHVGMLKTKGLSPEHFGIKLACIKVTTQLFVFYKTQDKRGLYVT